MFVNSMLSFNGITRFEFPSAQKSGLTILRLYAYIVVVVSVFRFDFVQTFITLTFSSKPNKIWAHSIEISNNMFRIKTLPSITG